jgi:type IV pilus assembly protein PilY1
VWDARFEDWNGRTRTGARYASLPAAATVTPAQLLAQSVGTRASPEGADVRTVSRIEVCWKGSEGCSGGSEHMGWSVPLGSGEQALYHPVLAYGMFLVNTLTPADANPLTCARREQGGYTMALSVENGGAASTPFFPDAGVPDAAGLALGATGSPSVVTTRRKAYLVQQTFRGGGRVTRIQPAPVGPGGRLNWIQLR